MPLIMQYQPGDLVDVRSASPTWWPGVVKSVDDVKIVVDLDTPYPTGNQWAGQTLPYGGTNPVKCVTVWIAAETVSPQQHIKARS